MEQYLQKAIADFPPYEGGGIEKVVSEPTIKCPDCDICFYTQYVYSRTTAGWLYVVLCVGHAIFLVSQYD
jgi:hypothetical protein